jgi:multiple sugar transport system permease protein
MIARGETRQVGRASGTTKPVPWRTILRIVVQVLLVIGALSMVIPFIWMLLTSLKVRGEVFTVPLRWLPAVPQWGNYPKAMSMAPFPRYFLNSAIMGVTITLGRLVVCSMSGYAFSRLRWPGRDTVFLAYLITMMIPSQVTLIPSYLIVYWMHWINTYYALIVPGIASAFGTFLLRQFFITLPTELEDAARIDGCNRLRVLWNIIIPLSKPALSALAIFTFMGAWNDFLWPLLVTQTDTMRTVQVGLSVFKDQFYVIQWPELMAGTTLVTLPVVVVYFFAQRQFIEGIAMTGLKG